MGAAGGALPSAGVTAEGDCEANEGPNTDSMLSVAGGSIRAVAFGEGGDGCALPGGVVVRLGLVGVLFGLGGAASPPLLDLASDGAVTLDPGRRFLRAVSTSLDTIATRDQSLERMFEIEIRICRSTAITSHSAKGAALPSPRSCLGVPFNSLGLRCIIP